MKARVGELGGSYFGTSIHIEDGPLKGQSLCLWFAKGGPSERQEKLWRRYPVEAEDEYGAHYECTYTFKMAERIVEMLATIKDEEFKDDI